MFFFLDVLRGVQVALSLHEHLWPSSMRSPRGTCLIPKGWRRQRDLLMHLFCASPKLEGGVHLAVSV